MRKVVRGYQVSSSGDRRVPPLEEWLRAPLDEVERHSVVASGSEIEGDLSSTIPSPTHKKGAGRKST